MTRREGTLNEDEDVPWTPVCSVADDGGASRTLFPFSDLAFFSGSTLRNCRRSRSRSRSRNRSLEQVSISACDKSQLTRQGTVEQDVPWTLVCSVTDNCRAGCYWADFSFSDLRLLRRIQWNSGSLPTMPFRRRDCRCILSPPTRFAVGRSRRNYRGLDTHVTPASARWGLSSIRSTRTCRLATSAFFSSRCT